MGKFKTFLMNEQVGLGDLGPRVDGLLHGRDFDAVVRGALVSTDWSGSEQPQTRGHGGQMQNLPGVDLTIPSVQRQGRITALLLNRNPIYVRLSDGTEAHFTYDEFRRIEGSPAVGKTMTVTFQRHPRDTTQGHSKIDRVIVND